MSETGNAVKGKALGYSTFMMSDNGIDAMYTVSSTINMHLDPLVLMLLLLSFTASV